MAQVITAGVSTHGILLTTVTAITDTAGTIITPTTGTITDTITTVIPMDAVPLPTETLRLEGITIPLLA